MRENRTSGSVRGALGNRCSYREMVADPEYMLAMKSISARIDGTDRKILYPIQISWYLIRLIE